MFIRLVLLALIVLTNIIQFHLLPAGMSKRVYMVLTRFFTSVLNLRMTIHGSPESMRGKNIIIMSNHYDGLLDAFTLYQLYYQHNQVETLWTVVKATILSDPEDTHILMKLLAPLKKAFIRSSYFLPYKRGDKEDGLRVQETIGTSGRNILVFPEGTTRKNGIPKDFKHGIFHVAINHGLRILPVTVKFAKDIGCEKGEQMNPCNFFGNTVDVFIHDIVDPAGETAAGLKEKVFHRICAPMLQAQG